MHHAKQPDSQHCRRRDDKRGCQAGRSLNPQRIELNSGRDLENQIKSPRQPKGRQDYHERAQNLQPGPRPPLSGLIHSRLSGKYHAVKPYGRDKEESRNHVRGPVPSFHHKGNSQNGSQDPVEHDYPCPRRRGRTHQKKEAGYEHGRGVAGRGSV